MTNPQTVFDLAMGLMDELLDGRADNPDTAAYKDRTIPILNVLAGELYPYSDTYTTKGVDGRPVAENIRGFRAPIGLDDYICRSVMPYGLAAHLLLDENPAAAGFFQQRYEELLRGLRAGGVPRRSEDVEDVYGARGGVSPYNGFSAWG